MQRRIVLMTAAVILTVAAGAGVRPGSAWATAGQRVDCGKVMSEVQSGKKAKDIATDLKISPSSVYRCKKKAKTAGMASNKPTSATASPAAATSPKSH